jgi:hypothetical protein
VQLSNLKGQSNNILKYNYVIKNNPLSVNDSCKLDNLKNIEVNVEKINEHKHSSRPNHNLQILAEESEKIALDIISYHGSSSKK